MKRSEINRLMASAIAFLRDNKCHLPPFAFWTPQEWRGKGPEARDIPAQQLGWDITDFGSGDFARVGLLLFTLRNGTHAGLAASLDALSAIAAGRAPASAPGKIYGEKLLIVQPGQLTPCHFHAQKMEDIIHRGGGGRLALQLWNATQDDELDSTDVTVRIDGVRVTVPAGGTVTLGPGESVCLPQRLYHQFWGEGGTTLVGEVSLVNDDRTDNHFHPPVGRFPAIEEDAAPLHLLAVDYPQWYRGESNR